VHFNDTVFISLITAEHCRLVSCWCSFA
jgi:hypothetical protein